MKMKSPDEPFLSDKDELQIKQALAIDRWSPFLVKLAIAAKKESRNNRGEVFNCFVVQRPTVESKQEGDEFLDFLEKFRKNIANFEGTTRFQLAVYNEGNYHWTTFDFLIVDKKVHVFCLDAANDASADASLEKILEIFPDCDAYRLEPDYVPEIENARIIQHDRVSCSRMTLEHSFILSKNNFIFDELSAQSFPLENKVKIIGPKDLIKIAPEIYRTNQSWSILNSFSTNRETKNSTKAIVSKKGFNLFEYAFQYSVNEPDKKTGVIKLKNKTIDFKKSNLEKNILGFSKTHGSDGINSIIDNSRQEWSHFLEMTTAEREESNISLFKEKTLQEIIKHVLEKNLSDNIAYLDNLNSSKIKISNVPVWKTVAKFSKIKELKKNIIEIQKALEIIKAMNHNNEMTKGEFDKIKNLKLPDNINNSLVLLDSIFFEKDQRLNKFR